MGLLDVFNSDEGMLGLGLLAAAGPTATPASLGQRMAGVAQMYRTQKAEEEQRKLMQEYRQAQMAALQGAAEDRAVARDIRLGEQAERERARAEQQRQDAVFRGAFAPVTGAQAVSMAGGPTNAAAQMQGQMPLLTEERVRELLSEGLPIERIKGAMELSAFGRPKLGNVEPGKYSPESVQRFMQTNNYADLVPIERLDPNKPFMVKDGQIVPNSAYQQYELSKAQAGSTRVNVPVSVQTGATFGKQLAEGVGKSVSEGRDAALGAIRSLDTVSRIESALNSGKLATGPFANQETVLRRLGESIGVGGRNNQEVLANTQQAIKGLAQLSLDGASQIKGQGQVTEAERQLVQRAASGDITLSIPELRVVMDVSRRVSTYTIGAHQRNVQALRNNPDVAPIMPFFDIQAPQTPFAPAGGAKPTHRFNPQTGALEEVK